MFYIITELEGVACKFCAIVIPNDMKWSIASCEADIDVVFGVCKDILILSKCALIQFFTNARYNIVELRRTCGQGHEIMISMGWGFLALILLSQLVLELPLNNNKTTFRLVWFGLWLRSCER